MNVSPRPLNYGYPVFQLKHPEGYLSTSDMCVVVIPSVFAITVFVLFIFYIIWRIFLRNSTTVDRETLLLQILTVSDVEGRNEDTLRLREVPIVLSSINIE